MCEKCANPMNLPRYLDTVKDWEQRDCILYTEDSKGTRFLLFLPCDDYYYTRYITINNCPWCGRKLCSN